VQERVPALIFTVRDRAYGLLQDGGATLLPWLQRDTTVSPVPGVPPWLLGLLHVQGTVQPVVDLGLFMGWGESARGGGARLIFVEHDEICAGLLVDGASGIRYLDRVEPVERDGDTAGQPLLAGTASMNGASIRILDGCLLIDALAGALGTPRAPGGHDTSGRGV